MSNRGPIRTPIDEVIREDRPPGNQDAETYRRLVEEAAAAEAAEAASETKSALTELARTGWATPTPSPFWRSS